MRKGVKRRMFPFSCFSKLILLAAILFFTSVSFAGLVVYKSVGSTGMPGSGAPTVGTAFGNNARCMVTPCDTYGKGWGYSNQGSGAVTILTSADAIAPTTTIYYAAANCTGAEMAGVEGGFAPANSVYCNGRDCVACGSWGPWWSTPFNYQSFGSFGVCTNMAGSWPNVMANSYMSCSSTTTTCGPWGCLIK